MIEAILKIKTSLEEAAAEALAVFGEGGNPSSPQVEGYLAICNTPPLGGYTRILTTEAYGMALEYIAANGGSENADLIRVEWPALMPEDGWPPVMVDLIGINEDGTEYTYQQEVGRFA